MARRVRPWGSVQDRWGSVGRAWGATYGTFEVHKAEYHVVLGGRGLMLSGRTRGLAQPFAAPLRTSTPSSSNRLGEQVIEITGWQGGEGTIRHLPANPSRFRNSGGVDIYSKSGEVQLGPHITTAQATALDGFTCMESHEGKLYVGTSDGKIYSWDGTTWTLVRTTGKAGGIRSLKSYAGGIFAGNGTDGVVEMSDTGGSGTWATSFTVAGLSGGTVNGVYALQTHYLLDANQIAHEKLVFGASSSNYGLIGISDSAGTPANQFAIHETNPRVLVPLKQNLILAANNTQDRKWALFRASESYDDTVVNATWRHVATYEDGYITCGATLGDVAYFGDAYYGRIWSWDGTDIKLHRQLGSPDDPYSPQLLGMVVWQGGLWLSILDTDNTIALLRDNGSSDWCRPATGLAGTTPGPLGIYAGNLYLAANTTGDSELYQTNGTFRSAGEIEQALLDAGLPGDEKLWTSVRVTHSPLASGQSVAIQYQLEDDGGWTTLGTSNTVDATEAEFSFPSSTLAKLLGIKTQLAGSAGSSTALKVYDLTIAYRLTRRSLHEWTLNVRLEGADAKPQAPSHRLSLADGTSSETLTGEELADAIQTMVDTAQPVSFFDIDRREQYTVVIEEWSDSINTALSEGDVMGAGWDLQGQLRLRQVDTST